MFIEQRIIPQSKFSLKAPYHMDAEDLIIHNTYNDAPAINEAAYMTSNNSVTGFHFVVDHQRALQLIPLNRNSFNAGDGANGRGNRKGIAIEICYSKSGGARFIQAEINGAKLAVHILKQKGWGIERMKKHQDYSGKYCPHRTLDLGWQRFVNMVRKELGVATIINTEVLYFNRFHNQRHNGVKKLQEDLNKLGFKVVVDGSYGPAMESAVKSFQRTNGLNDDGSAGPSTLKMIEEMLVKKPSRTYFIRGDKGDKVKKIQSDLKSLGYKIDVDGSFGPAMDKTVRQFQADNKLGIDGSVGPATLRKISILLEVKAEKGKPQTDIVDKKIFYRAVAGSFNSRKEVAKRQEELKKAGFDSFIDIK